MAFKIIDDGKNNEIEIDESVVEESLTVIHLRGSGNRVSIAAGVSLSCSSISLGEGCSLTVGRGCRLASAEVVAERNGHVAIGEDCIFTWSSRFYLHEASRISVGRECLVASGVLFMSSDAHSILDRETGERVNPAADIEVAEKVWLGHDTTVLKGSSIGTESVIGYRSVIHGVIPMRSLAIGSPARIVRSNITWDRHLL